MRPIPRRKPTSNVSAALARYNAVQHGLTAEANVIPGVESAEEWRAHYDGIVQDLAPSGAMEAALVDRIARLAWRLRRVDRYECASIAASRERVEFDFAEGRKWLNEGAKSLADAEKRIEAARRCLKLLEGLRGVPPATPLSAADVEQLLGHLADSADELPEDYTAGIAEADGGGRWTPGRLIAVLKAIAVRDGEDFAGYFIAAVTRARAVATGCERDLAAVTEEVERMRAERILPDGPTLDRIVRYEAALNRMLYQALNQLEAAQARRAGAPTPLHRLQAFGLPGG